MQLESLLPVAQESAGTSTPWLDPTLRIGKYEVGALVGKGAMGAVYQAHDPLLERDVALKVMLPQIAHDPEQKQRFEREARAVARLTHRNVVMVFDLGYHTDGSPYIAMELLRGRDLLQALRNGPALALEEKISVVLQVLEGLGQAHKIGIVHRDIKPANVFMVDEGVVKIMDFGIARLPTAAATAAGVVFGTANYMSPEQVLGGPLDGRSDLFSVGCMLCEMLTGGQRPFDSDTMMTTLYRIVHQEPAVALPDTPEYEGLLPIVVRSLAKRPEDRYATASDFAAALRGFLEKSATPAARQSTRAIETDEPPSTPPPPAATCDLRILAGGATDAPRSPADPTALFRLLRAAYVGGKSGHLHCTDPDARRSLCLVKGRIVHGTSDVCGEHLGDVMVRFGLLSQADLQRAVAVVLTERKRLGRVLSELGLTTPESLQQGVKLHVREILHGALDRPGSSFVLEEMTDTLLESQMASDLSTGEVILEATRRVQDPDLVRKLLGNTDRVLILSSNPLLRSQKITLAPTDGFVLSRIDGVLTAREVIGMIPLPPADTERSLFGLLSTGTVDYLDTLPTRPSPAPPTRPRVVAAAKTSKPPAVAPLAVPAPPVVRGDPGEVAVSAPSLNREELRRLILETHEGLRLKDHFEVLGLEREATDLEVKTAYRRFARLLHPDACHDPALADLTAMQEAVFIRVCEAYEVLRDKAARARYETRIAARPRPAPIQTTNPAPAAAPAGPTPARHAPRPVRFDGAASLRAAERLLADARYWDAIQALEPLIPQLENTTRLRGRVALATAYMKNPKWLKRAEDVLQSVVAENPGYTEAYVALGNVYLASQLQGRASAMYRRALELNPDQAEAREALDSLDEARMADRPSSPRSLGRLFRKR